MKPFSEFTRREKLNEILRWLFVLPAAILAGIVARFALGAVVQLVRYGRGTHFGHSSIEYWLVTIIYYAPRELVFVVAGAMVSPRYRKIAATGLGVLSIFVSLMTHVIGQHLAGNHVGPVNYTHCVTESAGAIGGVAFVGWWDWRQGRRRRDAS